MDAPTSAMSDAMLEPILHLFLRRRIERKPLSSDILRCCQAAMDGLAAREKHRPGERHGYEVRLGRRVTAEESEQLYARWFHVTVEIGDTWIGVGSFDRSYDPLEP